MDDEAQRLIPFNTALRIHMEKHRTGVAELSRVTGVSIGAIKMMRSRPDSSTSAENAEKIARYYRKSVSEFLQGPRAESAEPSRDFDGSETAWRTILLDALEARGETMRSASLKAGFGANYLHGVLKDGKDATVERLLQICKAFQIDPAALIVNGAVATELGGRLQEDEARLLNMFRRLTADEKTVVLAFVRGHFPFD